jgi:SPP1 family predicted phage head-tail adaptor
MRADIFDPGRMTARLDLEFPLDTPDGQGGAVRSYTAGGAMWTLIAPRSAVAAEEGEGGRPSVEHDLWIRHRSDIVAGARFRKGARVFSVLTAFDPDETRRYLVCRCREDGR